MGFRYTKSWSGDQKKVHKSIFTLPPTFLRWTYFRSKRFIHRWTSTDYVTLSLSDDMDKQTSSLVVETFDWRYVMTTAVERNGRMLRLVIFVRHVVCIFYTKWSKIMHRTVVKNVNIKHEFNFFCRLLKLTWRPSGVTYFARDPLRSYFHEPQKNEIYCLNEDGIRLYIAIRRVKLY